MIVLNRTLCCSGLTVKFDDEAGPADSRGWLFFVIFVIRIREAYHYLHLWNYHTILVNDTDGNCYVEVRRIDAEIRGEKTEKNVGEIT